MRRVLPLAVGAICIAGCAAVDLPVAASPVALVNSSGQPIGRITASQTSGGITLAISASSLPHGLHGLHVHAVGRCDAPQFESAGSHWNPAARMHGLNNPAGPHAGDLPNLTVSSSGVAAQTVVLPHSGLADLADADGSALVVHAAPDDYMTDPSGNSGARIACAVLAPPR